MYLERALHAQGDRTSRLLAEISAKLESVLRYFVEIWQVSCSPFRGGLS
jgi:hypothetical protein